MYKIKIWNPPVPLRIAGHFIKKAVDRKLEVQKQTEVDYSWPTNMYV